MPEKIPDKELDQKTAQPEVAPVAPAIPKPQPVELILDEADALFPKRTDL